ncbi:hypothetical protein ABZW10_36550 [Kitasatospora sp. NPDC004723]|uniref:hypothetical protein n=1 Tax=Kitasatospora sp. NPDC004723 TaxID=3154288 RepID=UPI0033A9BDE9
MSGESEMDDLRHRVEALEAEMERVREQAGSAHTLAALADRDAAEVRAVGRANNQLLTALRDTQREQGEGLAALQRAVETMAQAIGGLATGQAALQEGQRAILAELRALRRSTTED